MFSQIKMAISFAVLAAFGILFWLYEAKKADYELLTAQYNQAVERHERDAAKIREVATLMEANAQAYKAAEADREAKEQVIRDLNKQIAVHKENNDELVKIFSDHDFAKLVKAKPGLIQRRMRTGTELVFKQLENATAGNTGGDQGTPD